MPACSASSGPAIITPLQPSSPQTVHTHVQAVLHISRPPLWMAKCLAEISDWQADNENRRQTSTLDPCVNNEFIAMTTAKMHATGFYWCQLRWLTIPIVYTLCVSQIPFVICLLNEYWLIELNWYAAKAAAVFMWSHRPPHMLPCIHVGVAY